MKWLFPIVVMYICASTIAYCANVETRIDKERDRLANVERFARDYEVICKVAYIEIGTSFNSTIGKKKQQLPRVTMANIENSVLLFDSCYWNIRNLEEVMDMVYHGVVMMRILHHQDDSTRSVYDSAIQLKLRIEGLRKNYVEKGLLFRGKLIPMLDLPVKDIENDIQKRPSIERKDKEQVS